MNRPANGKGSRHRLGKKADYDKRHDEIKWKSDYCQCSEDEMGHVMSISVLPPVYVCMKCRKEIMRHDSRNDGD